MEEKIASVKTRDKISCKTDERPRMSLDMVGECILILLDCKSGNIERLLLRFCDENQSGNFCAMCNVGTEIQSEALLLWYPSGTSWTGGASIGPKTIS